ncbi:MAG TPA: hybrid sensor histidine kinase/response regulator [Hymenobacter sp.]|uniref:hybrid sensor histidine kinase/response regulator n=1 Tax=Hymenobacter sp. TaxID=1898978 RepID=UPI002D7E3BF3|nr:hybrid sensor histidine kinase/response regulator [Hymenobacter sp.]HET9505423.1 hybrid sensor histidine kinase/response regulator [Hymenobacter sp.]
MKKILLVDDNEQDRMLYKRYLKAQPGEELMELHEAASGEAALELFVDLQPDCVLLDHSLQDTDGLTLLEELKQLAPDNSLCAIMITGSGSERLAVRALNSGALDYLMKQHFDRELLQKTVRHAIEKNEWRQYQASYHQQLQAANQQLARTNADLDNFVYAASHDLRQPVNNLRGLFEEIRRSATFADPADAQLLPFMDKAIRALSTTIDDLATVVQENRQPTAQAAEPVALADLADDVLTVLHPQVVATEATISLNFNDLPEVPYVRSNLRTILLNLVANALKYRHPERPPQVALRTYRAAGQPVLEVQDNGLGINLAHHREELFQLFRRFHPQAAEGTGVGLFLVNRLVQAQEGHIDVESEEGQGTLFRVFLGGK